MLLSMFMFGTFWFWALLGVGMIVMTAFIVHERDVKAALTLVVVLAALALFGDFNALAWIRAHAVGFCVGLGVYLAFGTVFAVFKWWRFVGRLRDTYDEAKARYLQTHGLAGPGIPVEYRGDWRNHVRQYVRDLRGDFPPQARSYKGKIVSWMTYWPWNLLWTLINDPIRRLFKAIFQMIQGILQGISDRAFQDTADDFKTEDPPADPSAPSTPRRAGDTGGRPASGNGGPPAGDFRDRGGSYDEIEDSGSKG